MLSCHICSSKAVTEFTRFPNLGRATSDCKPWPKGGRLVSCANCGIIQKIIDTTWRDETKQIYAAYTLYELADGKEQPVFNSETGQHNSRSGSILNYLQSKVTLKDELEIIDIGCGVGNTLRTLSQIFSQAKLFGLEPNPHNKEVLHTIPNVQDIYIDTQQIDGHKFDIITLIHVLEHVDSPIPFLQQLAAMLKPDGFIAIGVPNYVTNPFDLIITDHCSHFAPDTLQYLFQLSGLEVVGLSDTAINKELVAICKLATNAQNAAPSKPQNQTELVQRQLYWLEDVYKTAKNAAQSYRPFGIFGTAIAANWLYGQISEQVDYFVDEDADRIGKLHHQKPIYNSSTIPTNSHLFICLQPNVVDKISARIKSEKFTILPTPAF